MSGEPIARAKAIIRGCLGRLRPCDTFQVIRFSDRVSSLGNLPLAGTPENVRAGISLVESLSSEGGTNMMEGIQAALGAAGDEERYRIIAFLTDGFIGNDREVIAEVHRRVGTSRIFSIGIGSSVNRFLLEGLARAGRGVAAYSLPGDPDTRAVEGLFRRLEQPAMTDIRVSWEGVQVTDQEPPSLPDLFPGRPVRLVARFSNSSGRAVARVTGRVNGQVRELRVEADPGPGDAASSALSSVWARARIARLYDRLLLDPDPREVEGKIRTIALEHGLLSDFTAFVAVDSLTRTAGSHGTTVIQPVVMPAGVKYETTVR